jgi:hypothetical protein
MNASIIKTSGIFLLVTALFTFHSFAQQISPEDQLKALKDATKESEKLQKKGWLNNLEGTTMEASFINAYEAKYTTDSNGVKYYVPAFGNAFAATKEEAESIALTKCKNGMFDIMMLYFYMWNMSNDKISDTEKSQVEDALKTTGDKIKEEYSLINYETIACIYRQDDDRIEFQLRIIFIQQECKDVAKREIKKVLASKYAIGEERGEKLLTYPK